MQEKIRRKDKVEVDMAVVGTLMKYQKDINEHLRGTNFRCSLHPKSDLEPCTSCSLYKICKKHKKERDYIETNHTAYKDSKRRKQKESKCDRKNAIEDLYKDDSESEYPCGDFEFSCPNKENCNGGQQCPYN